MGLRPDFRLAVAEAEAASDSWRYAVGAVKKTDGKGKPAERYAVMAWADWLEILRALKDARL
jgi:hypothetical protein